MRVLVLHSPYLSGAVSGENRVVADETRLLAEGGHDVSLFEPDRTSSRAGAVREGLRAVWSKAAVEEVRRRLGTFQPDVVHCHNLFPALSPAVLRAARRGGVPVVVTLHNYRLMCLPATLRRGERDCTDCFGRVPWRGVVHRCYRGSALASGALGVSLTLHRALHTLDSVGMFLSVSGFVRDRHVEAGFAPERLRIKPNFAWPSARRAGPGEYFLYAGRLSPEKGIAPIVSSWSAVPAPLVVVGEGPQSDEVQDCAGATVEFRGAVSPGEMVGLLAGARAVLVPSRWADPAPRIVLEAYAAGVPVLVSPLGGLPELVDDGITGLVVHGQTLPAWHEAIHRLCDDGESERLGAGAWQAWHSRYAPERALAELEDAYGAVTDEGHDAAMQTSGVVSP